jgi:hypothetical protein
VSSEAIFRAAADSGTLSHELAARQAQGSVELGQLGFGRGSRLAAFLIQQTVCAKGPSFLMANHQRRATERRAQPDREMDGVPFAAMGCPNDMKQYLANSLRTLQRPVAVMLTLLPAGALVFSYFMVQWASNMMANGPIANPDLAMTIEGIGSLFGNYAIPVLSLSVVLATLNLCCAFTRRTQSNAV